MISNKIKWDVLVDFLTTKKKIKVIAQEKGLQYAQVIRILQEYKDKQPDELIKLLSQSGAYKDYNIETTKKNFFIKEKEKEEKKEIRIKNEVGNLIYELRKQGLTYTQIKQKLDEQGYEIGRQLLAWICKEIFMEKGEKEPNLYKKEKNDKEIARSVLNLMVTRKATLEQIEKIAEYYGVDLEKTMESLEER